MFAQSVDSSSLMRQYRVPSPPTDTVVVCKASYVSFALAVLLCAMLSLYNCVSKACCCGPRVP